MRLDMFYVDKAVPVPLYYQLKQRILELVKQGVLQVGDTLPTENELCEQLGISRPTIRQALNDLVNEGYLTRQKGKGTFISRPKIDARFLQKLESFNDEMRHKGMVPATRLLALERVAGVDSVNARLQLEAGEPLIRLERLRFADDEPVVYLETYVPYNQFPGLLEQDFVTKSLYDQMEQQHGRRVSRVKREIEAVNANKKEAELLRIKLGKAVCLVKTLGFTEDGQPVEYSVARYRGDRTKFGVELYR